MGVLPVACRPHVGEMWSDTAQHEEARWVCECSTARLTAVGCVLAAGGSRWKRMARTPILMELWSAC